MVDVAAWRAFQVLVYITLRKLCTTHERLASVQSLGRNQACLEVHTMITMFIEHLFSWTFRMLLNTGPFPNEANFLTFLALWQ
jgi:hypothetical protein